MRPHRAPRRARRANDPCLRGARSGDRHQSRAARAPVGIGIHNATIEGRLDFEGCAVDKPLVFLRCRFVPAGTDDTALHLRDASLKRIALYECTVTGAIKADRAHFETAFFLTSSTVKGMVRLRGASVGEALAMDSTSIENPGSTAILADGLRLGGPWILRSGKIAGEVRFAGARISGGMLWEDCQIRAPASPSTATGLSEKGSGCCAVPSSKAPCACAA